MLFLCIALATAQVQVHTTKDVFWTGIQYVINSFVWPRLQATVLPTIPMVKLAGATLNIQGMKLDHFDLGELHHVEKLSVPEEFAAQKADFDAWTAAEKRFEKADHQMEEVNDSYDNYVFVNEFDEAARVLDTFRQRKLAKVFYWEAETWGVDKYSEDVADTHQMFKFDAYQHNLHADPVEIYKKMDSSLVLRANCSLSTGLYGTIALNSRPFPFSARLENLTATVKITIMYDKQGLASLGVPEVQLVRGPATRLRMDALGVTLNGDHERTSYRSVAWSGLRATMNALWDVGPYMYRRLLKGTDNTSMAGWLAKHGKEFWGLAGTKVWGVIFDAVNQWGEQTDIVARIPDTFGMGLDWMPCPENWKRYGMCQTHLAASLINSDITHDIELDLEVGGAVLSQPTGTFGVPQKVLGLQADSQGLCGGAPPHPALGVGFPIPEQWMAPWPTVYSTQLAAQEACLSEPSCLGVVGEPPAGVDRNDLARVPGAAPYPAAAPKTWQLSWVDNVGAGPLERTPYGSLMEAFPLESAQIDPGRAFFKDLDPMPVFRASLICGVDDVDQFFVAATTLIDYGQGVLCTQGTFVKDGPTLDVTTCECVWARYEPKTAGIAGAGVYCPYSLFPYKSSRAPPFTLHTCDGYDRSAEKVEPLVTFCPWNPTKTPAPPPPLLRLGGSTIAARVPDGVINGVLGAVYAGGFLRGLDLFGALADATVGGVCRDLGLCLHLGKDLTLAAYAKLVVPPFVNMEDGAVRVHAVINIDMHPKLVVADTSHHDFKPYSFRKPCLRREGLAYLTLLDPDTPKVGKIAGTVWLEVDDTELSFRWFQSERFGRPFEDSVPLSDIIAVGGRCAALGRKRTIANTLVHCLRVRVKKDKDFCLCVDSTEGRDAWAKQLKDVLDTPLPCTERKTVLTPLFHARLGVSYVAGVAAKGRYLCVACKKTPDVAFFDTGGAKSSADFHYGTAHKRVKMGKKFGVFGKATAAVVNGVWGAASKVNAKINRALTRTGFPKRLLKYAAKKGYLDKGIDLMTSLGRDDIRLGLTIRPESTDVHVKVVTDPAELADLRREQAAQVGADKPCGDHWIEELDETDVSEDDESVSEDEEDETDEEDKAMDADPDDAGDDFVLLRRPKTRMQKVGSALKKARAKVFSKFRKLSWSKRKKSKGRKIAPLSEQASLGETGSISERVDHVVRRVA